MNMTTNTFSANDRVRMIGAPRLTGTFVHYYKPLPSGKVNVEVRWDDATIYMPSVLSIQIEAI
ncbi:hypothetical protein 8UZL_00034 [Mycobacteroides phage 8UZL]|nr:hypothetical protein 8UZL_00034 [Mycobacteroides phage 8UZL]